MHSQDGYKLIRAEQLIAALAAVNDRQITFRAFRAYLACHELLAIREAADRVSKEARADRQRRFRRSELESLLGDPDEGNSVSREIAALKAAGLLTFTESAIDAVRGCGKAVDLLGLLGSRGGSRLVPVPRQVLKFLARCTRPALAKTIVAYLLRGLALERSGKVRSAGTVKVSWICRLCKISERAARSARAELIRLGWITKDTGSFQRKLNRDGAYFIINLAWRFASKRVAPPPAKKCTRSAPPIEKQETPYGTKNQKPALPAGPGVCVANKEQATAKPTLRDIKVDDLRRLSRLRVLFAQATAAGWIDPSEANLRNFIAAAARATRINGDAVRVFVGIVRKGLWHHLTSADEDRANAALRREAEASQITGPSSQAGVMRAGEGTPRMSPVTPSPKQSGTRAAGVAEGSSESGRRDQIEVEQFWSRLSADEQLRIEEELVGRAPTFIREQYLAGQQERGLVFQAVRRAMINEYVRAQLYAKEAR